MVVFKSDADLGCSLRPSIYGHSQLLIFHAFHALLTELIGFRCPNEFALMPKDVNGS